MAVVGLGFFFFFLGGRELFAGGRRRALEGLGAVGEEARGEGCALPLSGGLLLCLFLAGGEDALVFTVDLPSREPFVRGEVGLLTLRGIGGFRGEEEMFEGLSLDFFRFDEPRTFAGSPAFRLEVRGRFALYFAGASLFFGALALVVEGLRADEGGEEAKSPLRDPSEFSKDELLVKDMLKSSVGEDETATTTTKKRTNLIPFFFFTVQYKRLYIDTNMLNYPNRLTLSECGSINRCRTIKKKKFLAFKIIYKSCLFSHFLIPKKGVNQKC